jgi:hypothetical protein
VATLSINGDGHGGTLWNAWIDGQLVQSVTGYADARQRAEKNGHGLRIQRQSWDEMVASGVAPADVSDDVVIYDY